LSILGLAALQRRVPEIGSLHFFELTQAGLTHPTYHLATNRVYWQSVAGFDNSGIHDVFESSAKRHAFTPNKDYSFPTLGILTMERRKT